MRNVFFLSSKTSCQSLSLKDEENNFKELDLACLLTKRQKPLKKEASSKSGVFPSLILSFLLSLSASALPLLTNFLSNLLGVLVTRLALQQVSNQSSSLEPNPFSESGLSINSVLLSPPEHLDKCLIHWTGDFVIFFPERKFLIWDDQLSPLSHRRVCQGIERRCFLNSTLPRHSRVRRSYL